MASGSDKSIIELEWKDITDNFCKTIELLPIAKRVWIDPLVIINDDELNRKVVIGIDSDKQGFIKELLESRYKTYFEDSIKAQTHVYYKVSFVYLGDRDYKQGTTKKSPSMIIKKLLAKMNQIAGRKKFDFNRERR